MWIKDIDPLVEDGMEAGMWAHTVSFKPDYSASGPMICDLNQLQFHRNNPKCAAQPCI